MKANANLDQQRPAGKLVRALCNVCLAEQAKEIVLGWRRHRFNTQKEIACDKTQRAGHNDGGESR